MTPAIGEQREALAPASEQVAHHEIEQRIDQYGGEGDSENRIEYVQEHGISFEWQVEGASDVPTDIQRLTGSLAIVCCVVPRSDRTQPVVLQRHATGYRRVVKPWWVIALALAAIGCGRSGYQGSAECAVLSDPVVDLFADGDFTCAERQDGSVWCWGANDSGQLGDGTFTTRHTPAPVNLPGPVTAFGTGQRHACAHTDDDNVYCWGRNQRGQLALGNEATTAAPAATPNPPAMTTALGGGSSQTLVVTEAGELYMAGLFNGVGNFQRENTFVAVALPGPVRRAAGASSPRPFTDGHSCAVLVDGRVYCWGTGLDGQLGHGLEEGSATPVEVLGIDNAIDIATGNEFSCALLNDGEVRCWGDGGSLGAGATGLVSTPIRPTLSQPAAQLAADDDTACVVTDDAEVWCWGGFPAADPTPTRVEGLGATAKVAVGEEHACALGLDGLVRCWGQDLKGQLARRAQPWTSEAAIVDVEATVLS
ncbi:MAG: hypothetical protein KJO07_11900, partial [Deltaproteobacteria bacterium]|nr:hypothetical protein [Deltaproteobacteria bacterium]